MHQIPPWSLFGGTDSDWRCQMNAFRGRLDLQGRLDLHTYIHTVDGRNPAPVDR